MIVVIFFVCFSEIEFFLFPKICWLFSDNHYSRCFRVRISWRLNICCWLTGRSKNAEILLNAICFVSRLFFWDFFWYFCFRINWRLTTCCWLNGARKILKAYFMLLGVLSSIFMRLNFPYFQSMLKFLWQPFILATFFRIDWHLTTCCWLSGHEHS